MIQTANRQSATRANNQIGRSCSAALTESEVVLILSRNSPDERALCCLRQLLTGFIDWPLAARIADQHAVLPMFYANAKRFCWNFVPVEVQQLLKQYAWENSLDSLKIASELPVLVSALEERGVWCIPFKGPLLSERLYNDASMRGAGDLDIIVPEDAIDVAIELLSSREYKPCKWRNKDLPAAFFRGNVINRFCHEYTFFSAETGVTVDLHWKILPPAFFSLSNKDLLLHRKEWSFRGEKV